MEKPPKSLEGKVALYREFSTYAVDETVVSAQEIHIPKMLPSEPPEGLQVLYSDVYDAEAPVEYEYFYFSFVFCNNYIYKIL